MKAIILLAATVFPVLTAFAQEPTSPAELAEALHDMQDNPETFEALAQRAQSAGVPKSVILKARLVFHFQRGELTEVKALLTQVEALQDELLTQTVLPISRSDVSQLMQNIRQVLVAWEKRPNETLTAFTGNLKRVKAKIILEDLQRIDTCVDQAATEKKLRSGTKVPVEQWRSYLRKDTRLYRTATDPFGNPYGPMNVDKLPAVPRASYDKIKDVVPADFFKPHPISEK